MKRSARPRGVFTCASVFVGAAALALAMGCAPVPRPSVLADVEKVRAGATATEAKERAPGAFAQAEKLKREADAAFEAGDIAGAQILGERALAAYAHAHALARIARAEASSAAAAGALAASTTQLSSIDADQARVSAELSAAELRVKVAQDAQPVIPSGPADAEREKARFAAARALAVQAKLLCTAARILLAAPASSDAALPPAPPKPPAPSPPASPPPAKSPAAEPSAPSLPVQLDQAIALVASLEAALATAPAAPIDQASRARAACLSVLTGVRRSATPIATAPGVGDALLTELSSAGSWSPSRDDRGVVVTLRGLFKGDALTPAGAARLSDLGRVASAHPAFPLVVIIHHDKVLSKKDEASSATRADRVARALKDAKAPRVEVIQAGASAPVVDPAGAERARNARVEVVFVTPETF